MKILISILVFSCVMLKAFAQEKIILDAIPKPQINKQELLFDQPLIPENSFGVGKLGLFDAGIFNQPLLPDYNKILDIRKSFSAIKSESFSDMKMSVGYSPFFSTGKVFNSATYRLSDKFSFGGNSFGAQSVFDQPAMNPAIQNMSTKGASMFMQYKVSRNFKIETRVSVSNHSSPW
ncbi:MAG TPA: hypothetical protein PLG33_00820 [Prolixibacteraceae bacterium]|nr:hypothetical protein [Prolixibacteraceae bacterium]